MCHSPKIVTDSEPYSNANRDVIVMRSLMLGKPPGSVDFINNVPQSGTASNRTLGCLKSIIPDCWTTNPADRPSSSDIFNHLASLLKKETTHQGNKDVSDGRSQVDRHPKLVYGSPPGQDRDISALETGPSVAVAEDDVEDLGMFLLAPLVGIPSGSSIQLQHQGDSIDPELLAVTRYNQPSQRRRYRDKAGDQDTDGSPSGEAGLTRKRYLQLPKTTKSKSHMQVLSRKAPHQ
ncbi:hypothetical protein FRC01_013514 [Tulasnella sp. 417]|nr:hypothetical protein FRC01_013514 [Tulasnella sp. 417]